MRNAAVFLCAALLTGSVPSSAIVVSARMAAPRVMLPHMAVGLPASHLGPAALDGRLPVVPILKALPSVTPLPLIDGIPSSFLPQGAVQPSAVRAVAADTALKSPLAALESVSAELAPEARPAPSADEQREISERHFTGSTVRNGHDDLLPTFAAAADSPKPGLEPSAPSARRGVKVPVWRKARGFMKQDANKLALAAFAWGFLTIAAYSIIGPARGALLLTKFGPDTIPWVYLASAALTGLVVSVYNRFSKAPRKALIGGSLGLLTLTLAGGAVAVAAAASPAASFAYYLWTDVFGIMSVTLFWTYQNDVFTHDEAKRLFGFVAAGAPLGNIVGSFMVKTLVAPLGPVPMLLMAAGVFAAVLPIFFWMEHRAQGRTTEAAPSAEPGKTAQKGVLATIFGSRFLIFLTALVALERLVPDITNYLYSVVAAASFAGDPTGLTAFFANVNFWSALASFAVSSVLVGLTIRRLGIGGALMTAGAVNLLLFALFPFSPTLALVGVFFGLDGVARYTWFKTAKETTYSATDRDVIYRVKAFVEMFVYRFARGAAGFLLLLAAALRLSPSSVALIGIPLALAWLYCAWQVGREHVKLEAAKRGPSQ